MTLVQIKQIAAQQGIKVVGLKKADIVRAIQLKEGNAPCFASGKRNECGQADCLWHVACE